MCIMLIFCSSNVHNDSQDTPYVYSSLTHSVIPQPREGRKRFLSRWSSSPRAPRGHLPHWVPGCCTGNIRHHQALLVKPLNMEPHLPHCEIKIDQEITPLRSPMDTTVRKSYNILLVIPLACSIIVVTVAVTLSIAPQRCDPGPAPLSSNGAPESDSSPGASPSSTSAPESDSVSVHPITTEERFSEQQKNLWTVPKCEPMLHPVRVMDKGELPKTDDLRDKVLLPPVVPIKRCPESCGLCIEGKWCLSTRNATKTVILKFQDTDNQIKYEERDLLEHLECACHWVSCNN